MNNKTFVENSNLPERRVKSAAIGNVSKELRCFLCSMHIEPIVLPNNDGLSDTVKNHADMNLLYLRNGKIVVNYHIAESELYKTFTEKGFDIRVCAERVKSPYPNDSLLNACILNDKIICNTKIIAEVVKDYCCTRGLDMIHTNQGYSKCSVLPVTNNALITDDPSISRICIINGIDVCLVSKGDIKLEGFDYGFIGGCGCKIDKDLMLFFGDIKKHRDHIRIIDFLSKYGVHYVVMPDHPLTDIGGMIPLLI